MHTFVNNEKMYYALLETRLHYFLKTAQRINIFVRCIDILYLMRFQLNRFYTLTFTHNKIILK